MNKHILKLGRIEINVGLGYQVYQIVAATSEQAVEHIRQRVNGEMTVIGISILCPEVLVATPAVADKRSEDVLKIAEQTSRQSEPYVAA